LPHGHHTRRGETNKGRGQRKRPGSRPKKERRIGRFTEKKKKKQSRKKEVGGSGSLQQPVEEGEQTQQKSMGV